LTFVHQVSSPHDASTGMASGKRQHKPIVITKERGASNPQLWSALVNNENLKNVTIEFTKMNNAGIEYVYNTVKLTNATIVKGRPTAVVSGGIIKQGHSFTFEYTGVGFTFRQIEVNWTDGGKTAQDSWDGK
jgi:type VI secretion system secreted protein Hcp